ncbi:hypothetical protein [Cupriavidus basilensis]|uniref:hypothetical protein n=1 Tax=Cupriavidus basilensis TaxID=68895 RepID=UPI0011865427|nr:hypothetical protein [Cupriavidus basilensis]
MKSEEISQRCNELIARGVAIEATVKRSERYGREYWVTDTAAIQDSRAWLSSAQNLIRISAPSDSHFSSEIAKILGDDSLITGVPTKALDAAIGLLRSLAEELDLGLLRTAEFYYTASTFDEFLDHAEDYHKRGKITESAVLSSAVFEDAVRKTADKAGVPQAGINLDPLIDALVKKGTITPVKAKRWKAHAAVRNEALHAQWDKIELRDVGDLIRGTREIIEDL